MRRPRPSGAYKILIRIVEVAGDNPCSEAETARRFDEENREIPAGSPAAVQSLDWRLGTLIFPALIADLCRDAGAQVFEQGKRVGRITADERPRPALNCPAGSEYCWFANAPRSIHSSSE